ncbi:formin-like protein 18 [Phaseolus vulgaris]|uniref:formin-like protein 18 n=1 Tax=Phaseolus vulgaris TaxID=3885 RepID=UPI0035CC9C23
MNAARAAKASASSAPAADPNPPSTLPPPPPTTTEAPLGSSSPSPRSPEALQTPGSPPPIAAVPLAVASSPAPTPLDKGKRVLEIISDDEDSDGVAPFKRRKAARVPLLSAASPQGDDSFRDNPPSATSLPPTMVQEETGEGDESAPPPPPVEVSASPASVATTPDLIAIPPPIMHLMRGFSGGSMPEGSDRKEGMPFYLGAFLAVALEWRAQARNAVLQTQTLQALETRVVALEEEKKTLGRQNETYQTTLKQAQEAKEEAEKQLAEAVELQVDSYTREVTLQVQVAGLQGVVEAYDEVQKVLKSRCCEQADKLERTEGEMATQAKAMGLLQVDYDKLQVEVSRLRVEKEALEKQVASGDAIIEELEKDKKTLIHDMGGTFEEGFKEALAQAVCENPGIDVSNCDSTHHIVDGKVVPLEMDD